MPGALSSASLRGTELTSTSGRPACYHPGNACCAPRSRAFQRARAAQQSACQASNSPALAHCTATARRPRAAQHPHRRSRLRLRCRASGGSSHPAISLDEDARPAVILEVEEDVSPAGSGPDGEDTWSGADTDTPPHPSPPEDLNPTDLLVGQCTIQELASQVTALTTLVQAQQDILYSQKAQIDQLVETLQEERARAALGTAAPLVLPEVGSHTPQKQQQQQQQLLLRQQAAVSPMPAAMGLRPYDSQRVAYGDRRLMGLYDARFHSTHTGAIPQDFRILPDRIILVRHAESEGNVDNKAYTYIPDSQVPLTARGHMQAREAGKRIKELMEADPVRARDYKLFFYISPYKRSLQTYEGISSQFPSHHVSGVQEEVQLREQDFGNFQDHAGKQHEKAERLRFGRFFYRFPNGESGADVYDRITIFEDHMVRDINAGRFADNSALVLVSHGLALRIFLMRWFHWTVDEFLSVYNPANAEPLVLERCPDIETEAWRHTKSLYRLTDESMRSLRGCTAEMCSTDHLPRKSLKVSTRLM